LIQSLNISDSLNTKRIGKKAEQRLLKELILPFILQEPSGSTR